MVISGEITTWPETCSSQESHRSRGNQSPSSCPSGNGGSRKEITYRKVALFPVSREVPHRWVLTAWSLFEGLFELLHHPLFGRIESQSENQWESQVSENRKFHNMGATIITNDLSFSSKSSTGHGRTTVIQKIEKNPTDRVGGNVPTVTFLNLVICPSAYLREFWTKEPPLLATGSTRSRPRATLKFHGNRNPSTSHGTEKVFLSHPMRSSPVSFPSPGRGSRASFDPKLGGTDIYPCWFANWCKKTCKKPRTIETRFLTQISFKQQFWGSHIWHRCLHQALHLEVRNFETLLEVQWHHFLGPVETQVSNETFFKGRVSNIIQKKNTIFFKWWLTNPG